MEAAHESANYKKILVHNSCISLPESTDRKAILTKFSNQCNYIDTMKEIENGVYGSASARNYGASICGEFINVNINFIECRRGNTQTALAVATAGGQ